MKIYKLEPTQLGRDSQIWGWDSYDAFIVIAKSEQDARTFAGDKHGTEGNVWIDPRYVKCRVVGTPDSNLTEPGIILGSFNAG